MSLAQLPSELVIMVAEYTDKDSCANFRLASPFINQSIRTTFARTFARVRKYTITDESWALSEDGGADIKDLVQSLTDSDFGPAAMTLKIVTPNSDSTVSRLLAHKDTLPGLQRVMKKFKGLEEIILQPIPDARPGAFPIAWFPGTIFRTLGAEKTKITQLTVCSSEQEGRGLCITALDRDQTDNRAILPINSKNFLGQLQSLRYHLRSPTPWSSVVSPSGNEDWESPATNHAEFLHLALDKVENMDIVQDQPAIDIDTSRPDALYSFVVGDNQLPALKSCKIDGAVLMPDALYDFARAHVEELETLELSKFYPSLRLIKPPTATIYIAAIHPEQWCELHHNFHQVANL